MEKFNETKLPSKEHYFNTLTDSDITDEEYTRAKLIFETFNLKTLGELHDLYVATDVLLLTNVMERYR